MLREMRIQNFKAWRDTGSIRLAPITVFFGANSAGKTSLLQFLLMLKQTAESPDRRRVLNLGDAYSLVSLGNFKDILYKHSSEKKLDFEISWDMSFNRTYKDPTWTQGEISWSSLSFQASLSTDSKAGPEINSFSYRLSYPGEVHPVTVELKQSSASPFKYKMRGVNFKFVRTVGRGWDLRVPVRFYGFPDEATAYYQNAAFVSDLAGELELQLRRISYLGPLREHPQRLYTWSGEIPEHVGPRGEQAIAALLSSSERQIVPRFRARSLSLPMMVSKWLNRLGLLSAFAARKIGTDRKEYEVSVQTPTSDTSVLLPDVGFGVSQVLPVIVECFHAPENSTVVIEQPELHLHPRVQSELADLFIEAIKAREDNRDRNMQFIIESHSEHFLTRLQRRVAEGTIAPDDVAIYYCESGENGSNLRKLNISESGDIANWPDDFFGDEFEDLTARLDAAMQRELAQHA